MLQFIEVTSREEVETCNGPEFEDFKVLVNIEQVIEIDGYGITTPTRRIATKETYKELKEKIENKIGLYN